MKFSEIFEEIDPYEPGLSYEENPVRMDKNENPFDLPDEVKVDVLRKLDDLPFNRYPQIDSFKLRSKLADFLGLQPGNIIVGSGSDELISYTLKIFAGDKVIFNPPTFSMYKFYSLLENLQPRPVPLGANFELNVDRVLEDISRARVVFLCSPNNPTGNSFSREDIVQILEAGKPVVLDEAYQDFSRSENLDLLDEYENLIILRTFSKAFSLAGARVGYAIAGEEIIARMLAIKSPYNLNSLSSVIAETMLDNINVVRNRVDYIIDERERVSSKLGKRCFSSDTNFLLVDLDAADFLAERGISVRSFRDQRLRDKFRVTIGTKEQNDRFLSSIEEYLEENEG